MAEEQGKGELPRLYRWRMQEASATWQESRKAALSLGGKLVSLRDLALVEMRYYRDATKPAVLREKILELTTSLPDARVWHRSAFIVTFGRRRDEHLGLVPTLSTEALRDGFLGHATVEKQREEGVVYVSGVLLSRPREFVNPKLREEEEMLLERGKMTPWADCFREVAIAIPDEVVPEIIKGPVTQYLGLYVQVIE